MLLLLRPLEYALFCQNVDRVVVQHLEQTLKDLRKHTAVLAWMGEIWGEMVMVRVDNNISNGDNRNTYS